MSPESPQSAAPPVIEVAPSPAAELRGLRTLLPRAARPAAITDLVQRAAAAGLNALAVRVYRRGTTLWPSEATARWRLPSIRPWSGGRDVTTELARACLAEGIALLAWVDLLPAVDLRREKWSPLARRHWAWRMRRADGSAYPEGRESDIVFLCPTRLEVRRFLGDVCVELAERHPIHGIWFEGLRYPLDMSRPEAAMCCCPVCRERVEDDLGLDLDHMPDDLDSEEHRAWTGWRQAQLHALLTEIVTRVRRVRRGLPIFGGVIAGWSPDPRKCPGLMDWARWTREGLIDTACPMSLEPLPPEERLATLRRDFEAVDPAGRLAPALPIAEARTPGHPVLDAVRTAPLSGVVWDAADQRLGDEDWQALRALHGERPALVPEIDPRDSMHSVIAETTGLAARCPALLDYLTGLSAVLQSGFGQFSDAQMGDLLDDLASFQTAARRGQLDLDDAPRARRNLDWLQRQILFLRGRQLLTESH